MSDVLLIREGNHLAAADPVSAEALQAMRHGEFVTAEIRRTRNPGHHKKFFALLNAVYENQTRYATLPQVLTAVKIGTGYYDTQKVKIGDIEVDVYIPKSISFGKMNQDAFDQFYNRAIAFVLSDIIPGLNKTDLERRVEEIIAGNRL